MKCDTCKFKITHIGFGPPDDYSDEYCSKSHWIGSDYWTNQLLEKVIESKDDPWVNCIDFNEIDFDENRN